MTKCEYCTFCKFEVPLNSTFDSPANLCDNCWNEWWYSGIFNVKAQKRKWNDFFEYIGKYDCIDESWFENKIRMLLNYFEEF